MLRMALNLGSSCFSLLNDGIVGVGHSSQLRGLLVLKFRLDLIMEIKIRVTDSLHRSWLHLLVIM